MSDGLYLVVMLGIVALSVAVIVPAVFLKRCGECGARNGLDAQACRSCGWALSDDT